MSHVRIGRIRKIVKPLAMTVHPSYIRIVNRPTDPPTPPRNPRRRRRATDTTKPLPFETMADVVDNKRT